MRDRCPAGQRARTLPRPRALAWARRPALLKTGGEEASLLPSQYVSSPPETGGEEGIFGRGGAHCAGTYYMGRPGGRRGSCGAVGPPASGQRATAIADHGSAHALPLSRP